MENFAVHIGVDESGKGDFFGPLVIAGVLVNEKSAKLFTELGIKDSKKISDKKILELEKHIKANAVHSVVAISNSRYNELYANIKNLNRLLAWGHARVIENIAEKHECEYALSDQFGDESLIKSALMKNGRNIRLEQMVRAESDVDRDRKKPALPPEEEPRRRHREGLQRERHSRRERDAYLRKNGG